MIDLVKHDVSEQGMPDTTRSELRNQCNIVEQGLYFEDKGEVKTPTNLYFGCSMPFAGMYGGQCYTHYDNSLIPVYRADGSRYYLKHLRGVSAYYKNGIIQDFHIQ